MKDCLNPIEGLNKVVLISIGIGFANVMCWGILESKHKTSPLLGFLIAKFFTIVLQYTSAFRLYYSQIAKLNIIILF